jgi:hypothetical protein
MATQAPVLIESSDLSGAFPRLSYERIRALETVGQRRRVEPGDVLYREGDGTCDFLVILERRVALERLLQEARSAAEPVHH